MIDEIYDRKYWQDGIRISERVDCLSSSNTNFSADNEFIRQWVDQIPYEGDIEKFNKCLSYRGLNVDSISKAIGGFDAELVDDKYFDWLQIVKNAFEADASSSFKFIDKEKINLLVVCEPLINYFVASLVSDLSKSFSDPKVFQIKDIPDLTTDILISRLDVAVTRAVIEELHVSKENNMLNGDTSELRYREFIESISTHEGALSVLIKYPSMTRAAVTICQQWYDFTKEFFERIERDFQVISDFVGSSEELGVLTSLGGGYGDIHNNGRTVLMPEFSNGSRIVYKPRAIKNDKYFVMLASKLNEICEYKIYAPRVIDREMYGWCEYITRGEFNHQSEICYYYENYGALLAVLYLLQTSDIHHENLIPWKGAPCVIDFETMFHPTHPYCLTGGGSANFNVENTHMLPLNSHAFKNQKGIDISALGAVAGQDVPGDSYVLVDRRTDRVRVELSKVKTAGSNNHVVFKGSRIFPLDHEQSIIRGFRSILKLVTENKHYFKDLMVDLPKKFKCASRYVLTATNKYSLVIHESFHPRLLGKEPEREKFLDKISATHVNEQVSNAVIDFEIGQLLASNVPLYSYDLAESILFTSTGEPVELNMRENVLDNISKRINVLDEELIDEEVLLIKRSLERLKKDKALWLD